MIRATEEGLIQSAIFSDSPSLEVGRSREVGQGRTAGDYDYSSIMRDLLNRMYSM